MIIVKNVIELIQNKFINFNIKIDEFKPNEAVHIYIDCLIDLNFELCVEITTKWIGISKLDKKIEINFSSNDEVYYCIEDFEKYLALKYPNFLEGNRLEL